MTYDTFQPYIKHTEADKREKGYAWYTAIGLQDVDGLKPSPYLLELAKKNIETFHLYIHFSCFSIGRVYCSNSVSTATLSSSNSSGLIFSCKYWNT